MSASRGGTWPPKVRGGQVSHIRTKARMESVQRRAEVIGHPRKGPFEGEWVGDRSRRGEWMSRRSMAIRSHRTELAVWREKQRPRKVGGGIPDASVRGWAENRHT